MAEINNRGTESGTKRATQSGTQRYLERPLTSTAKAVARVGDPGSHGGTIGTGSDTVLTNGRRTARVNDTYNCAKHGSNPLTTGSSTVFVNGRKVVRVNDRASCGAIITSGSPNVFAG